MIIVLSPSKTLDYKTDLPKSTPTEPLFEKNVEALVKHVKKYTPSQLKNIMDISPNLASLNAERYANWENADSRPAMFAYKGDVYEGLDAYSFSKSDIRFAQEHFRIISGLYGVLRPLDNIKPYRIAFDNDFEISDKKNLYDYWENKLSKKIQEDCELSGSNILINLASQEYFKAIQTKDLKAEVITPVFKDYKNGAYKTLFLYAKQARGMMSRFIIKNKITSPDGLLTFAESGYEFNANLSKPDVPVFTRG